MRDADGDTSTATLTINVKGANDTATVTTVAAAAAPDHVLYEHGLRSLSDADISDRTTGTFSITATDGVKEIVVGGTTISYAQLTALAGTNQVINTGEGTLTLTGYTGGAAGGSVSYSYVVNATIDNDSKPGATGTEFDDVVGVTVNGKGGTTSSDNLIVRIVDDVPTVDAPNALLANAAGTTLTASITGEISADGNTYTITGAKTAGGVIQANYTDVHGNVQTVNLTYQGQTLSYTQLSATEWVARAGTTDVFTLSINNTNDTYSINMIRPVDPVLETVSFRANDVVTAGITSVVVYEDGATDLAMRVTADTNDSASGGNGNTDQVNTNSEWIGTGSQAIDANEVLILEFADTGSWNTTTGVPTGTYAPATINSISFATVSLNSGEKLQWVAYDADGNVITDANWTVTRYDTFSVNNTTGVVTPGGTTTALTETAVPVSDPVTVNGTTVTTGAWEISGDGNGGNNEDYYVLTSDVGFSKIALEAATGSSFDVGYIDVKLVVDNYDLTTQFEITVTDGDGDKDTETVDVVFVSDNTFTGTATDDVIVGSTTADTITGEAGNDLILAGGGADSVDGGVGNDTILGGDGSDTISGGVNNDSIDGGTGNDSLLGGDGTDTLDGGDGSDTLDGGLMADVLEFQLKDADVTPETDQVNGLTEQDTLLVEDVLPTSSDVVINNTTDSVAVTGQEDTIQVNSLDSNDALLLDATLKNVIKLDDGNPA